MSLGVWLRQLSDIGRSILCGIHERLNVELNGQSPSDKIRYKQEQTGERLLAIIALIAEDRWIAKLQNTFIRPRKN